MPPPLPYRHPPLRALLKLFKQVGTWNGYDGNDKHVGVGRHGVLVGHGRHDGHGAQCGHARHYEHVGHRRHDRHGGYDGYDRHGHQFKVKVCT